MENFSFYGDKTITTKYQNLEVRETNNFLMKRKSFIVVQAFFWEEITNGPQINPISEGGGGWHYLEKYPLVK